VVDAGHGGVALQAPQRLGVFGVTLLTPTENRALEGNSGQRTRHRLNRGGDRALNRALHTVAITRIRHHAETRAHEARRTLQGKTHPDIRRCLKHTLARHLYRGMESTATKSPAPKHNRQT
jgi:hypothetical protein